MSEQSPFQIKLGEELLAAARRDFAEQRRQMEMFGLDPDNQADCDVWEATAPADPDAPVTDYEEFIPRSPEDDV